MKNPNKYPYVILNKDFNFVHSDGTDLEDDGTPNAFTDVDSALREIETFTAFAGSIYYVVELVNVKKVTIQRKLSVENL